MAPSAGVNPRDLASSGWGIILPEDEDPRIREALEPLLRRRRAQAGERYRELRCLPGESKAAFLSRHGVGPGPADPDRVPYYLLIVGDPATIDFGFQSQLDIQYAVGRLYFEDLESYHNYARNVVEVESGVRRRSKRMAVFGVENEGDPATSKLTQELLAPLAEQLSHSETSWDIESIIGQEATKLQLASLLGGGEDTLAFLFAGGHGVAFRPGAPEQREGQGALVCSDWHGPEAGRGPLPQETYFSAADVSQDADLAGLVVFAFGCFTAGTPLHDNFDPSRSSRHLADIPFVAALPQRLLGKPSGAIAFIGNIDRAWNYSWNMGPEGPQISTFLSTIASILAGLPIGHAMEYFNQRYAELAVQMNELLKTQELSSLEENEEVARLWFATADAQNFLVLGDPAVTLLEVAQQKEVVVEHSGESRQRASASTVEAPTAKAPVAWVRGPVGMTSGALNDRVLEGSTDYLSYSPYSQAFADLISSPYTSTPLTIGIFGDWGAGKSFLLKSIKNELKVGLFARGNREQPVPIHAIEFNAWEYSAHEQIWPGLVRKILGHMEERLSGGWWHLWWARIQRNFRRQLDIERGQLLFLLVTFATGLAITAILAGGELALALQVVSILVAGGIIKFVGELISNPLGSWIIQVFQNNGYGKQIGMMEEIAADLRFLDLRMKNPKERILVIIDDLDRCEPNRAVEMLKAIKLLLDFDRFVILIGIDARLVGGAVEKHYEDLLGKAGVTGSEYLDKIIQIPFQIPSPSEDEVEFFIKQLTGNPQESTAKASGIQGKAMDGNLRITDEEKDLAREVATAAALASSESVAFVPSEQIDRTRTPAGLVTPEGSSKAGKVSGDQEPQLHSTLSAMTETYETVDLSFSFREMCIFQQLISHIYRNPRHIKKALNIYRLVRAIAFRKQDLITLRHPEETILWVTLCLQWPQELNLILQELEHRQREPSRDAPVQLATDPLPILFEQIRSRLPESSATSERCRRLQWLLSDSHIPRPDHLAMLRLQRYAIHTRPWEEALKSPDDHSSTYSASKS